MPENQSKAMSASRERTGVISPRPALKPGPKPAGRTTPCQTCGESKNDGRAECGRCRSARYRSDPAKAERARESVRSYRERQAAFADQMKEAGR